MDTATSTEAATEAAIKAEESPGPHHILYPPGGLLIWSLVLMELITFGIAIIALVAAGGEEQEVFQTSRAQLTPLYGVINTVFLLTSGYCMALSVSSFKEGSTARAKKLLSLTMLGGLLFLVLKAVEYNEKITQGFTLGYDTFFTYYWLLTVFHVMHVLVGLVILVCMMMRLNNTQKSISHDDYEAGAVFWHMCDLIWLILFPALYLLS
ncbi:MAG: cytochrome c oxidase subunit 3 [Akkermansiaceae bacterium]